MFEAIAFSPPGSLIRLWPQAAHAPGMRRVH